MFCTHCGNQMKDTDEFCSGCGHPVGDSGGAPAQTAPAAREIQGDFPAVASKVPLQLMPGEVLIEQRSAAFVMSSIAQGQFSLTNRRIIFTKDSGGKAFFKRGGLIGMAMSAGANIPSEISLDDIKHIAPTSCLQGKAAMLITIRSGYQYKIALQSMAFGKTGELCQARDRIIQLVSGVL